MEHVLVSRGRRPDEDLNQSVGLPVRVTDDEKDVGSTSWTTVKLAIAWRWSASGMPCFSDEREKWIDGMANCTTVVPQIRSVERLG